jgi:hypothetical protein
MSGLPDEPLFKWGGEQPPKGEEFDKKHAHEMKKAREARDGEEFKKASEQEQGKKERAYNWYHGKGNRKPGTGQLPGSYGAGKSR